MKIIFTLIILVIANSVSAQWSNTTNQFYDSLHMPVSTALKTQAHPLLVKSYPDSGYFVIWEDFRNDPSSYNSLGAIYAQKYDKDGNQLWTNNGVPVANSPNNQHYYFSSGQEYRNFSYAATDSGGGFYIAYADDSVTNYIWERECVQHIRNDGSAVFGGAGYIIVASPNANAHVAPQLIADGNKGFFLGYLIVGNGYSDLYVYCYKDENGTLKNYGGGQVDINAYESPVNTCNCNVIAYRDAYVYDYMIYSDLQNGCNVTMTLGQNAGGNERLYTGYNWLWRAKADGSTPNGDQFKKDDVTVFYKVFSHSNTLQCGNEIRDCYILDGNGYKQSSNEVYGAEHTKTTVVPTDGNINVVIMAVNERRYLNNAVTNWFTHVFYRVQQKFDDIPYEYTVGPYYKPGFVGGPPPGQNKLGSYDGNNHDTLFKDGNYFYDFSLASGSNQIFSSTLIPEASNNFRSVRLQHLAVERKAADSFAVIYKTDTKQGVMIGKDPGSIYDFPLLTVNNTGNALFYIREYQGPARVSPVFNGAELAWGAMGKRIGSGVYNGSYIYYSMEQSFVALDPLNGTGVITWKDNRSIPGNTGENIFIRHLDSINVVDYSPPIKMIKLIPNNYGPSPAYAEVLLGSSKKYSTFEALSNNGGIYANTPVISILDNYNLGNVQVSIFQNTGAIRTYNGKPYLDRDYTITPENNPNGAATINLRLFFTTTEFDALKAADASIHSPGDLAVIKQPATGSAPASYIFVAGEQTIVPQSWAAVAGGYYIEIQITGFSNFFIFKNPNAPLPVKFLGVQAQWQNTIQAKVSWQVAEQINVKEYTVQHSIDGNSYTDACTVAASAQTQYSCIAAANNGKNYYRVMETDNDGKKIYSKVVVLQAGMQSMLTAYPNPVKNVLYIDGLINYRTLQIADANGKIIQKENVFPGMQSINVSHLAEGVYVLTVKGDTDSQTLKFIKN